ncbi:MAG: RHS repeat-associated core domain-containing protein [Candidatus Aminicenantes bacterium]|jgi:RHS repeat-associated protein
MGKEGAGEGDTLADPTARLEYDLFNWQNHQKPNYVHTFAREKHGPANPRWQESYAYSDGCGNAIMTKVQAEPGKAKRWNTVSKQVEEIDANPRWVGNGRTIIDNKGNPVKQYEPYFSNTHKYESEDDLVETGVTPFIYYDPMGRNILTENPNGTFSKIEFDAWYSKSYDVNDTVKDSQWYIDRGSPDPAVIPEPTDPEQRAAWLAAKHYNTPGTAYTDSLGQTFYSITDYGNGKTTSVYSETDLAGRYAKLYDQLGRMVSQAYSNLVGAVIYIKSAEKGENWAFTDVLGRLVKIWDNNVRELRSTFDDLHRPVSTFVKEGGDEILFSHVVYGDLLPDAVQRNLKGKTYQLYDQAGRVTLNRVDFKGNVTEVKRKLTKEYKQLTSWKALEGLTTVSSIETAAAAFLEDEVFSSSATLDAINRPLLAILPDKSIVEAKYNEGNFLDSLRVKIRGEGEFVTFLEKQEYDAKGQRKFAQFGNGLVTNYFYDPKTFRLINLVTKKKGTADAQSLQNLHYTFDPVGNIVSTKDDAQQAYYFKNAVVKPESHFEYDAMYRLLKASGREHAGLGGNAQRNNTDLPFLAQLPHSNELNAVREYSEQYEYDDCGNIEQMRHIATDTNWTRRYLYEYQNDLINNTNRLKSTSLPGDADAGPYSATYQHDMHGNMTKMPHLDELVWNFMDQLSEVNLGGGGKAFYIYGLGGDRIRKMIERIGGKRTERIYLGAVEIYRTYQNDRKKLERSTLHVFDDTGKIAQVDTKIFDEDNTDFANPLNKNLVRFQYTNKLGSATLETNEDRTVISYEEYHPFGTSAYRSSKSDVNLSLKRYRFTGKERDDETGLYYFGARFYADWLGRWTSSDPAGFVSGLNLYRYCSNNPISKRDPNGMNDFSVIVRDPSLGRDATFAELQAAVPEGYRIRSGITAENYNRDENWNSALGVWDILERVDNTSSNPTTAVGQGVQSAAAPRARTAPLTRTLRNTPGGTPRSFTPGQSLVNQNYNLWSGGVNLGASGPTSITVGSGADLAMRAPGFIMEDTVLEQAADSLARSLGHADRFAVPYDLTPGSDFTRVWGPTSDQVAIRAGLSQMTVTSSGLNTHPNPGNTVQVLREIPRVQAAGGLMAQFGKVSGVLTFTFASQIDNPYVSGTGMTAGAVEFVGGSSYLLGAADIGGGYFGVNGAARLMTFGRGAGRLGGGVGMIVLSGYSGYVNIQNENYGVVLGDSAGVVGGIGVLAGSGPTVIVTGTLMVANYGGDWAERQVTPSYGRGAGIAAGTGLGLGVGGAVGGGLVAFGLVSNPVGWGILAIGGVAGFIGAVW